MTTVLLTGFEPFAGDPVNPSWQAVERLVREWSGGATLVAARLPVSFDGADDALLAAIEQHHPDVVIATGLAANRRGITVERVAINVDDARIPDNDGAQPVDVPIEADGAPARFSTLPIKTIVAALHGAGLQASVSNSAGTFVCNHVFYTLQGLPGLRSGFVHVPATTELAGDDALAPDLTELVRGLRVAVEAVLAHEGVDLLVSGGTLS
ncbi:pyroglutamyl-peptidase I [Desertivibrio insolitus]|uniref:pyroglutamyl-peptidase I n=1 Tax=Herbiconiux sp. SYSU D00978 TaxID=2812562 RepID=UPI001A967C48|nr:pyroglutamyl-peptidase I [Herbiconiux sp. SYSU D00978]